MVKLMRSVAAIPAFVTFISVIAITMSLSKADPLGDVDIVSFCEADYFGCVAYKDLGMKCFGPSTTWGDITQGASPFLPVLGSVVFYGTSFASLGENLPFVDVGNNNTIAQLSCGFSYVCMRFDSGDMKCLGANMHGETGAGSIYRYIGRFSGQVGDLLPVVNLGSGLKALDVATGSGHTCVRVTGDLLKCFGNNLIGQLGLGSHDRYGHDPSTMGDALPFVDLGTNVTIASVHTSASAYHTCVILSLPLSSIGRVKCWGKNNRYQLGYGDDTYRGYDSAQMGDNLTLLDLGIESRVKQLSVGFEFTCAVLTNDDLKCFGANNDGELGLGVPTSTVGLIGDNLPAVPIGEKEISILSTGRQHACIVYDDKVTLKCVGSNYYGQLGQGDDLDRGSTQLTTYKTISAVDLGTGKLKISSIHCGFTNTCVVFVDSSVRCFGSNSFGESAAGTQTSIGRTKGDMGKNLKVAGLLIATASEYGTFAPTSSGGTDAPAFTT